MNPVPAHAADPGSRSRAVAAWHPLAISSVLLLLGGVVAVQVLQRLPPSWVSGGVFLTALPLLWCRRWIRWPGLILLGAAWCCLRAGITLDQRLPVALEGQDIDVVGLVVDLPDSRAESTRLDLRVQSARLDGNDVDVRGLLRLSWYGMPPTLQPCSQWQLRVRLKRPRGMVNPGGFDFERHALQQGLNATGYVRDDGDNRQLLPAPFCVDGLRAQIAAGIDTALPRQPMANLLRALAVGDQRGLDEHNWQVLRATGVGHLIAISGMHIGMLAGFAVLLIRLLWRRFPRVTLYLPGALIEAPFGLLCATAYSALAGFGLPTIRTLAMIAIVVFAKLWRRALPVGQTLALAMAAMLLADPLAVLSAGFWLSFVGVGWLVYCLSGGQRRWWQELLAAQGLMTLALLPLTVWFFGQSSIVGPMANPIAVPWISLVVVPLTLAGAILVVPLPAVAAPILGFAAVCMQGQWWVLERMAAWPWSQWYFAEPSLLALILASLGLLWALMPRGFPARWLGLALLLPLLLPRMPTLTTGRFEAMVIDVGQGLSVLVRTEEHSLLFDAGARFPSGFDLGNAVVVPAAHAVGVRRLDRLMVSHADNDHAGGAPAVRATLSPTVVESGEPQRLPFAAEQCLVGEEWTWDGVHFRVLNPLAADAGAHGNDRSCVLLVESAAGRLLLTGDISAAVEGPVAEAVGSEPLVLVVAHHGSKTSSSEAFLRTVHAGLALVSAGYRSRFGHPHPDVMRRFADHSVTVLNTADSGCIRVQFSEQATPQVVERCRPDRQHYWSE